MPVNDLNCGGQLQVLSQQIANLHYISGCLSSYQKKLRNAWQSAESSALITSAAEMRAECLCIESSLTSLRADIMQALLEIQLESSE